MNILTIYFSLVKVNYILLKEKFIINSVIKAYCRENMIKRNFSLHLYLFYRDIEYFSLYITIKIT